MGTGCGPGRLGGGLKKKKRSITTAHGLMVGGRAWPPKKKDGTEKETIDGPTFYQIAQTQRASPCQPAYQRSFQVPSRHYQFSSGGGGLYLGSDLMCCSEATRGPCPSQMKVGSHVMGRESPGKAGKGGESGKPWAGGGETECQGAKSIIVSILWTWTCRTSAPRHVSFVAALQLFRVFSSCDYMAAAKTHHCYLGQVAILGVRYCLIPDRCETFSLPCGKISCYLPLA
jgi:hypothetical protein